jgi:hypothetical protein
MLDDKAKEFFRRVLPWPVEDQGRYVGYCNVHWTFKSNNSKKQRLWAGRPFQTKEKLFSFIDWLTDLKDEHDIYFCTSAQKECLIENGKQKAVRSGPNALAMKAIWLDLDVKTPGVAKTKPEYETIESALAALAAFVKSSGLPAPSALAGSGGGVHAYWISDKSLSPEAWARYAHGLRALADKQGLYCDGGCTIDSARILRVPNTFNWKTDPPRPTKILGLGRDIDFSTMDTVLPVVLSGGITAAVTSEKRTHFADGLPDRMDPAFDIGVPVASLSVGCEREFPPLDVKPILEGCAFLRDAILTGGRAYANPLWHLTTLCATFLPDGDKFAHGFARGHPTYSKDETDALFARKLRERDERGIGWPGCAAIASNGCTKCGTCQHFGRGKSPLNLGFGGSAPAAIQVQPAPGTPAGGSGASNLDLPAGYTQDEHGYICALKEVKGEEGAAPDTVYIRLFQNHFTHPWVQRSPMLALNFTTTLDLGRTSAVCVSQSSMATVHDLNSTLYDQGVLPDPPGEPYVRKFFMSWLGKLKDAKAAIESRPFGWIYGDKGREGFAFGGMSFRANGSTTTSGFVTPRMKENYTPMGSAAVWLEATKLITDRKRSDLNCLLASGFAAPLIAIPAQHAVLFSVFGLTGNGKSTAVQLALSVWGHPKKEKHVKDSSPKSVISKLGELNNLPSYWDEMSIDKQKNVYEVFTTASEGVEGTKLKSDRSFAKQGDWQTMLILTSNSSFLDCVVLKTKDTSAGMYRVFEYKVAEPRHEPGLVSETDATRVMQKLEQNYGQIGLQYARMLGHDPAAADAFVMKHVNDIRAVVQPRKEERYWPAAAGTLLAGGHYAKYFGVDIDLDALRQFIIDTYMANRARVTREALEGGTSDATEDVLAGFLKAYKDETLWTNIFSLGRGKGVVNRLHGPPRSGRLIPINVHYATEERKLRISRKTFFSFLAKDESLSSYVVSGLTDHFGATYIRGTLGAGTLDAGTNEYLIEMKVPPGSALEEEMLAYSARDIDTGGKVASSGSEEPVILPPPEGSIIEQALKRGAADLGKAPAET